MNTKIKNFQTNKICGYTYIDKRDKPYVFKFDNGSIIKTFYWRIGRNGKEGELMTYNYNNTI